jgi:cyanocobalamin reductase (cyanide-eliminating) / alkylcobalamin dealkylase
MSGPEEVFARLREACAASGFDLAMPLQIGWYNDCVEGSLRVDDFGSSANLAVVVGNTRALWSVWRAALQRDPALSASENPLDEYTTRALGKAVSSLGVRASVRFAHDTGPRRVAIQRAAHVAGLAYLTPTHLSVHPIYGPWIALRAVVSLALPGPRGPAPVLTQPCGGCARGCLPAFERALAATGTDASSESSLRANWTLWLAQRDACPIGREHRYSEAQIRYHYLREAEALSPGPENVAARPSESRQS